jgi:hypothetical protein
VSFCLLSRNGLGPEPGHCAYCDLLIDARSRPPRYPGRGFTVVIDPREIASYTLGDAAEDEASAA